MQLSGKSRKLVLENSYFSFQLLLLVVLEGAALTDFGKLALLGDLLLLNSLVVDLLAVKALFVLLELVLLFIKLVLLLAEVLTDLVDQLVTLAGVLDGLLPLQIKLVAFLVQPFEFLGGFIELNLGGLGLSHLLLELLALVAHFDREFLNLEGQLLDLGLVSAAVLLQGEVVLLLLTGSEGPLLQLLLVPVHLQFELVHALVGLEDHVLDVVEAVLLVSDALLELLDLVLQATGLSLGDLLHVLFSFNFLVFGIDKGLGVHELHLN